MRSSILLSAGIAATANAMQILTAPNEQIGGAINQRRDLASCTSVASAVLPRITDNVPTVPADVANYLAFSATITDPCSNPTITGSIGSAYSTYASAYTSWREAHIGDFRALWQACSDVQGVATVLPVGTGQCSSLVAEITSAGPVGGGSGGGNGVGGGNSGNAGPRETGAVMAAAAVAGFVVAAIH
ncbi:uncharacterized protein CTRU02_205146 [Colletotrichum truncatum]|uniref:Uncharacterized protein n=1 Tax=Colletotrichum truncatum TaxID=5467 RepID=A0ACC3Z377_COLTU|nr:uncharacterized protein CTRU02_06032 [Colletotrichum truncatum]KAF6793160.1 hypothetical protein CTRU02_06032 [Colletotrichum truncatum]